MKKIQTFTLVSALLFANTSYGTKTQSISFTQATAGLVVAEVTAGLVGYFPKTLGVAAAMAAGGAVLGSFKERGALRDFSDAVLSRAKIFLIQLRQLCKSQWMLLLERLSWQCYQMPI